MKYLVMVIIGILIIVLGISAVGYVTLDVAKATEFLENRGYSVVYSTMADDIAAILAKVNPLPLMPADELTLSAHTTTLGLIQAKTDNITSDPALQTTLLAVKAETDNLSSIASDASNAATYAESAADEAEVVEEHLHGTDRWYGIKVPQTDTSWADATSMTAFQATSGNNTWGPALKVFGSADTLENPSFTYGDFGEILPVSNSSATVYRIRFIWGSSDNLTAINAGQWTEAMFIRSNADNNRKIMQIRSPRIPVTDKIWCQIWNASNNATLDFYISAHGYIE